MTFMSSLGRLVTDNGRTSNQGKASGPACRSDRQKKAARLPETEAAAFSYVTADDIRWQPPTEPRRRHKVLPIAQH